VATDRENSRDRVIGACNPSRVGKGSRSGLLSRQKYTTEQNPALPVLLCDVSKQQVTSLDAEGHLHALNRGSERRPPLSGSLN
jgi:hypothetical protein